MVLLLRKTLKGSRFFPRDDKYFHGYWRSIFPSDKIRVGKTLERITQLFLICNYHYACAICTLVELLNTTYTGYTPHEGGKGKRFWFASLSLFNLVSAICSTKYTCIQWEFYTHSLFSLGSAIYSPSSNRICMLHPDPLTKPPVIVQG